jgi:hypothetical protein
MSRWREIDDGKSSMPKADSAVLGNPLAFVVGATMLLGIPIAFTISEETGGPSP